MTILSNKYRPLPNFLCVGAQKAGTTTLHDILKQHPDIFLPQIKESKFFQDSTKYKKGLEFYIKSFFKDWKGEKAVGEIDPIYMFFENIPERIYRTLGANVKLIFMLRNPVDRAYSHYWMSYRRGYETETFEKAILLEERRIKKDEFHKIHFSYIKRGFYAQQIKRFLKFFPKENMHFIIFETEFLNKREKTIKNLFSFLEVNTNVSINTDIKSNPASVPRFKKLRDFIYQPNVVKRFGKYLIPTIELREKLLLTLDKLNQVPKKPPKLDPDFKMELINSYFIDDIKELENIIGKSLKVWYTK